MGDALALARLRLLPKRTTITERGQKVDSARHGRLHSQTAIVTCQCNRSMCRAMVRTITCQDFMSSGIEARNLDGVLVRFRSAKREESLLQVAGGDFR